METLAVLVIMAVLGYFGLRMYDSAKEKVKAEAVAKQIKTAVVDYQIKALRNSDSSFNRYTIKGPYNINLTLEEGTRGSAIGYFWVSVPGTKSSFCEGLKKSDIIQADFVTVNGELDGSCPGEVAFYFRKNTSDQANTMVYRGEDGKEHFCPENAVCDTNGFTCPDGFYRQGNTCPQCPAHASTCQDENTILTCQDGYILDEEGCMACPEEDPTCEKTCRTGQMYDDVREKCVPACNTQTQLICANDTDVWCCGSGLICDIENQSCKNGGGQCTYYFYEADETTEYTTNCSYSLSDESNVEYYYSDCYYDIGATAATANMTTEDIGNTSRTYDNPTVTGHGTRGGCPANKYCALFWQGATPNPENANQYIFASKPSTTTNNGLTGFLYGKCQTLSGYDSMPLTENKAGSGMMVANGPRGGCPENQYCALMWHQENWTGTTEPKIANADTGLLYGKCQTLSGYDTTPLIAEGSGFAQYRMGQGCPVGQYCRLLWVNGTCTTAQNGDKGEFSGTCVSMSPPTPSTINCPY